MIKVFFKRILYFMPYAAAYFLVLGLAALALVTFSENVLFKDGTYSAVQVACYIPADSELNGVGFTFISRMNSIEETVNFVEYDSADAVRQAVADKEAVAGLIIPEGFASSISSGANFELEIVNSGADSFDEHLVNDVMLTLATDLGVGQGAMQTMDALCVHYDKPYDVNYDLVVETRIVGLEYALDRLNLFDVENYSAIARYSLVQKMAASILLYVLLLSVFVFSYFCKGSNTAFIAKAKLSGIPPFALFMGEAVSVFIMMYAASAVIFVILGRTGFDLSSWVYLRMIPIVFIVSLIVTSVSYLMKSPVAAAYASFALFTILMYLAGGLLPLEFMPRFLKELSVFNPFTYLIRFTLEAMFS